VSIEKTPLLIGLRAARANFLPGLIIQAAMILLVLAYYFWPQAYPCFELLASAKQRGGYAFTFLLSILAGALLPMLLTICIFQRGKMSRENLRELWFLMIYWGFDGMVVDAFYRLQAIMFGSHADAAAIVKKVLVDQFLYNPFFAAPLGVACYEWKNQGYSLGGMSRVWTWEFYKAKIIPALLATWVVWIPVTGAIYSLPSLLQVPLFALALTFWVLMFAYINARRGQPVSSNEGTFVASAAE
jgi:hypothetical protein